MDEKISFDEYAIEFTDDDFKDVSNETLRLCSEKIQKTLNNLKEEEANG